MITLLGRIFIKDREDVASQKVRQAYGILCGAAGIALNLLLFTGKFLTGLFSRSIAITADAFNNLSDAASSAVTLAGFKMAGQEPDPDHPFGHGRIEYISGLIVSFIIILMSFELLKSSVSKIFHPEELIFSPAVVLILVFSIAVKCYMAFYNRKIGKKIRSAAMLATSTDSLSDSVATLAVLAATLVSHFSGLHIDGVCGVAVGLFVFSAGIKAAKSTIDPLLGQAPDPEFVRQIEEIVMSHDEIIGIHDLIVHNYGPGRVLISLHAEVSADSDICAIHDQIDLIEHDLARMLHCHAVIHMDPVRFNDPETNRLKELVSGYLKELSPLLSLHDFRIVTSPLNTKIIFDVAAPFGFEMQDRDIVKGLSARIRSENEKYFPMIEVDRQYTEIPGSLHTE